MYDRGRLQCFVSNRVLGEMCKQSIDTCLISTPALTHLHQFLTYNPMRLSVAPYASTYILSAV
jgi:hypothetical protein